MKRICKNCFNFIDRSYDICPVCHKPVKSSKNKKVQKTQVVNVNDVENVSVEEWKRSVWIPKRKRAGYKQEQERLKGEQVRVQGRHIDVSSIALFENKNANKYTAKRSGNYNDYKQEKLQWWEIYKKADRWLVKRKLNKIVKQQGRVKPEKTSYWMMLFLTICTGFLGLHNFYAKNYKRAITSLSLFAWSITLVALLDVWPWLINVQYSLIAFPALICFLMWISDAIAVLFKRYVYRESKLNFIYSLDAETRARLGNKYIMVPNWYVYEG